MSATLVLYRYEPKALEICKEKDRLLDQDFDKYMEFNKKNNHYEVFDKQYRLCCLRNHKSKTLKKFLKDWEHRFVPHWEYKSTMVLPVERLCWHTHRSLVLKKRWFKRVAWIHTITSKKGLYDFMHRYIAKESYMDFKKYIIDPFVEGEMFLEVSY